MLPQKLIESLKNVKGFDEKAFLHVHESGGQVTSVRLNPAKPFSIEHSSLNVDNVVPWCEHGRYLTERPSFTHDPIFHGGAYYVQEASSMFLREVLKQTIGEKPGSLKVLDLCAAPGGKSTLLASYFNDGLLVSNEVIKSRANILVENMTKWGSDNVIVTNNDPKDFAALENYFDVIVVDAPCSGSGLFRRDHEAINEWSKDSVALCSQRQQRILADVYPALRRDGILIYSTCSYSMEEDEDILNWLERELQTSSLKLQVKQEWNIVETVSGNNYGYRFYPDKIKGEGFFIAAFRKEDGDESNFKTINIQSASKSEIESAKEWIKVDKQIFFFKQSENIIAIPQQWKNDLAFLQKKLYLRKAGVTIGSLKGKDLVPDHELALSLLLNNKISSINVNKEQALQFLKRKDLTLSESAKGWSKIHYCGINLGWVKVLHNRVNNYYPVNWRILKD